VTKTLVVAITLVALVGLLLLTVVPAAAVMVTGRPLISDCGGLDAETCDAAFKEYVPRSQGFLPDIWIGFSFEPHGDSAVPGVPCGDYVFTGWLFTPTHARSPLC
jgi:hypothetical protein